MVTVEIRQFLNAVYHKAKNSGWVCFSRRNPDLSWERLLSAPLAFDEPAVSALLP